MAAGKVCTGFSMPYVARYSATGGTVTYSEVMRLARGVSVSLEPEVGDDNRFYADNIAAETAPGTFTGGTVNLTVDGLLEAAERFIMGLPEAKTVNGVSVLAYGDNANPPYVGIGFLARYMQDGVTSYTPIVLTKARFSQPSTNANTQEDAIDWQTQELSASLMRDDTANHEWKWVGEDVATEEAGVAALQALLGGEPVTP